MKNIIMMIVFVVCMTINTKACDACKGQLDKPCGCIHGCCVEKEVDVGKEIKDRFHPLNRIKDITKITVIGSFFKKTFKCENVCCECKCKQ